VTDALFVERAGKGFPLIMLHGWGMHGGIWDECVPELAARWRVIRPDLPGHGRSPALPGSADLDSLAESVASHCPREMSLLGWSLGGLVAMRIASRLPGRVRRLVLVAATPRFVSGPGWPCGVSADVLELFGRGLSDDYRRTVRDFLTLQVRGDEHSVDLLRDLKTRVFAHGDPDPRALSQGLKLLADTDLRDDLEKIEQPTLVISGDRDRITPADAGRRMADKVAGARFVSIIGASHAPFLSHRSEFLRELMGFLAEEPD
jgi:pimeloyl-[acyl-carrier protein] methyl ester esterase